MSTITNYSIIFVLGGPGAGKGTQCKLITEAYPFHHLSNGDLMRAEIDNPDSPYAELIKRNILEGKIGPPEMAVGILKRVMQEKWEKDGVTGFVIDGFPRRLEQAELFERTICPPAGVLFLYCDEEVQRDRLLERGKTSGRSDDNETTIQKRFKVFTDTTMPVIEYYSKKSQVYRVDANHRREEVWEDVQKRMGEILGAPEKKTADLGEEEIPEA